MDAYRIVHDPQYESWCVTRDDKPIQCFMSKEHAINYGLELIQKSLSAHLTLHRKDGSIESEWKGGATDNMEVVMPPPVKSTAFLHCEEGCEASLKLCELNSKNDAERDVCYDKFKSCVEECEKLGHPGL